MSVENLGAEETARTVEVREGFVAGKVVRARVKGAGGVFEGLGEDGQREEEKQRELREVELHCG